MTPPLIFHRITIMIIGIATTSIAHSSFAFLKYVPQRASRYNAVGTSMIYRRRQECFASSTSILQMQKLDDGILSSIKSPTVKLIKALQTKRKKRQEEGLTVIEGHRMVIDMLQLQLKSYDNGDEVDDWIKHVIVSKKAIEHKEYGPKLEEVLNQLQERSMTSMIVSMGTDEVLHACCDTVTPQGVVATCRIPPPFDPATQNMRQSTSRSSARRLYLILDGVSDPGNAGTLLRSALAVDVAGVILLPGSVDVYSPKAIRAGMGATFHVPIRTASSFSEALDILSLCEVKPDNIYAATMETASEGKRDTSEAVSLSHYEVNWVDKASALCLGQEGNGLSKVVRENVACGAINSVHVPMQQQKGVIESLNAAVCGSVVMFEYSRQVTLERKGF